MENKYVKVASEVLMENVEEAFNKVMEEKELKIELEEYLLEIVEEAASGIINFKYADDTDRFKKMVKILMENKIEIKLEKKED